MTVQLGGRTYRSRNAILQEIRELLRHYRVGQMIRDLDEVAFLRDLWERRDPDATNDRFECPPVAFRVVDVITHRRPTTTIHAIDRTGRTSMFGAGLTDCAARAIPVLAREDERGDEPEDVVDQLRRRTREPPEPEDE
jgi:hypothetical protein